MNILVLTDFSSHSSSESFYPLISNLVERDLSVYILDRALEINKGFYSCGRQPILNCFKVQLSGFNYSTYKQKISITEQYESSFFQVVLLRIDRPIYDEFLGYIDRYFSASRVINSPAGIAETSSKEYLLNFPDLCPEMKVCTTFSEIIKFSKIFPIVIKPLDGFRGEGICRIHEDMVYIGNEKVCFNKFRLHVISRLEEGERYLAVRYLKNVRMGDKRILVVNSKIVGSFNRVPAVGSWLANIAQGAQPKLGVVSEADIAIASRLSEELSKKGVVIYGFDVLTDDDGSDVLSEINVLNVGGFVEAEEFGWSDVFLETIDELLKYIEPEYQLKTNEIGLG